MAEWAGWWFLVEVEELNEFFLRIMAVRQTNRHYILPAFDSVGLRIVKLSDEIFKSDYHAADFARVGVN